MSALGWFVLRGALMAAMVQWAPTAASAAGSASPTFVSLPPGTQVTGLAAGDGAVWAVDGRAGTVERLDPQTNQVVATIRVAVLPPTCDLCWGAVAARDNVVWVAMDVAGPVVARINPTSNTIVETVRVGVLPTALAVGEDGGVWLVATSDDTVVHVDPHLASTVARIAIHLPSGITADRGAVWVSAWQPGTRGRVVRLDPATGDVVATIPVGRAPGALALADADVWVADEADDTVSRISARTNTVAATIPVAHDPVGVAIGTDAVWVVSRGSALPSPPTLSRVDPSRSAVVDTTPLEGTAPIGVAAGAGSLWVATRNFDEVVRIGPVALPGSAPSADAPPLLPVGLGVGTLVILMAGLLRQRPARSGGGRQRVPDGQLLGALLIAHRRKAADS